MDNLIDTGGEPRFLGAGTILRCENCASLNRISSSVIDKIPQCARCKRRLRQRRVILCDVSGSMNESAGNQTKIYVLREALSALLDSTKDCSVFAFSSYAKLVENPALLPQPSGGTAMHLGLRAASSLDPDNVLVISDGHPDSSELAFSSAALLRGRIDVIYIGPDYDESAKSFMLALASTHGGVVVERDLSKVTKPSDRLVQDARSLLENRTKR